MFTFHPLAAALAALCLIGALAVGLMGHLMLLVMRPPASRVGRLMRHCLRASLSALALGGVVVGLVGLYVAL